MTHVFTSVNMYDILKIDDNIEKNKNLEHIKNNNDIIPITSHNNNKINNDYNHNDYCLDGKSTFSQNYENDQQKDDWQYIIRLKYNNLDKYIKNSIINHSHPIPIKYSSFQTLKVFNNIINQYYRKHVNVTNNLEMSTRYKYESMMIRKINNFVKFTTYYEFLSKLPPNPFIISIGEGRGQDLGKYERFYPCRTLIIDLVESALDICEFRWNEANNPYPMCIIQYDFTCNFNINLYSYIWFCHKNNEQIYQIGKYCLRYDMYKKNKKTIKKKLNKIVENTIDIIDDNNDNDDDINGSNSSSSSSVDNNSDLLFPLLKKNEKKLKIYDKKEDFTNNPRFINCQFSAQYAYKDEISSKNFWNHIKNLSSHTVPGGTLLIISIPNLNNLVKLISKNIIKSPGMRSIKHGPLYIKELNNTAIEKHKSYIPYRFIMHKTLDVVEYTVDSKQLIDDAYQHGFYLQEDSKFSDRYIKYSKDSFFATVKKNMGLNNIDQIMNDVYLENNLYKMFIFSTQKKLEQKE